MRVIRKAREAGSRIVALGTFDGVHLGHARLIEEAVSLARAYGLPAAALTFDRHPLALIRPDAVPPPLTSRGAWNAHEIYTWHFILMRKNGGEWKLLTYGYA